MSPFDLQSCARSNVLRIEPYSDARHYFRVDGSRVFLDANENGFGPAIPENVMSAVVPCNEADMLGLNRYPDPLQSQLKQNLCNFRNKDADVRNVLIPEHVYLGVGANEVIDVLIRCFAVPGKDRILICPPTYAIYSLSAQINDVEVIEVPLHTAPDFRFNLEAVYSALTAKPHVKLLCLVSPNNPTGTVMGCDQVEKLLKHPTWNGVVVLDEAYIDYSSKATSLAQWVARYPNLVVIQTLSKAFGLAGIRFGVAFASPPIIGLLNKVSVNYNLPSPTSTLANYALSTGLEVMRANVVKMEVQRDRLMRALPLIPGVGRLRGGVETNFLLYEILDHDGRPNNATARALCENMMAAKDGVVVRFRGLDYGCLGCVRITVGTEEETTRLLLAMEAALTGNSK